MITPRPQERPNVKTRIIISWVLIVPIALLFAMAALSKLGGAAGSMFIDWGYPAWFAYVVGVVEAVGAIALLVPRSTKWAVYLLTVVMVGAAITHIVNAEYLGVLRPAIFTALMWGGLLLRTNPATTADTAEGAV